MSVSKHYHPLEGSMKRLVYTLLAIVFSIFLFVQLYHINASSPRLDVSDLTLENIQTSGPVLLEGGYTTWDENGRAQYHLDFYWNGSGYLYLPHASNLFINEKPILKATATRRNFYELPASQDNYYHLCIVSNTNKISTYQKALYFGTLSQINHFVSESTGGSYYLQGLCLAVTLFSFCLFLWKHSERYLLGLAILASFVGSYGRLEEILTFVFRSSEASFLHNRAFYRILNETLIAFFQFRVIKHLLPIKMHPKTFLSFFLIGALPAFALYQQSTYFLLAIGFFYFVLYTFFAYYFIKIPRESSSERYFLMVAWLITSTSRCFDLCCEAGIVPYGDIDLRLRFRGIISVIYVIAFFLIACKRFAQKFQEADDLNVHLEEEIRKKSLQQTTFIRSMLHNLKTPLFSLSGYSDMAMKTIDTQPATAKQYIQRTHEKAIYAGHMMDQIFFVTQMESGLVKFQQIPLNLADILHSVIETSQLQASQKHIRLTLKSPDIMTTCGDPLYLQQAFQNIVDNALIHTPENGHILVLGIQEKDRWRLLFTDSGCGIAPEEHSKIFDAYYSNRPDKSRSSGLGLYITKEIITHHQGTITVESLPDSGTTFVILLPQAGDITSAIN